MLIAVDFDGTIVEHRYPEIGEERPFATDVLRRLIDEHYKIVLWTMREGELLDEAVKWCADRGVHFYAINCESPEMFKEKRSEDLSCKLNADIFIDDRNIGGLPDWTTIYKLIKSGRTYRQQLWREFERENEEQVTPPSPKWMFWK